MGSSTNIGLSQFKQTFTRATDAADTTFEFHTLTRGKKAAVVTTVALAALTAVAGIVFLAGVGSIGTTAAWVMIAAGGGVALLVSIPLAIHHCMFAKKIKDNFLNEDEVHRWIDDVNNTIKGFVPMASDRTSKGGAYFARDLTTKRNGPSVILVHTNNGDGVLNNRIIFVSNDNICEQIVSKLEEQGFIYSSS